MKKNNISIIFIIVVITLTLVYALASTYAVIINITEENGATEIVNQITVRDLFINDDGTYNDTYYTVKNELSITEEEANQLMESAKLNENLQTILNSIVDYKFHNNNEAKLTNNQIYSLIIDGLNNTEELSDELKNKVINKTTIYIQDISNFLYDIEVSLVGEA